MFALDRKPITFRIDPEKRAALDALARQSDRDRSYLINEAIGAYLLVHKWQVDHIAEGLRQADAGEFVSDEDVAAAFSDLK